MSREGNCTVKFPINECGSEKPTVKPEFACLGELAWEVLELVPTGEA
jgi:hypothetical protein